MFGLVSIVLALLFLLVFKYLYQFVRNYVNAHRTGLPILVLPIDQNETIWMIFSVMLRPWLEKHLPSWLYNRLRQNIYGWEHHDKLRPFYHIGGGEAAKEKSYLLSGFGKLELHTASPVLASQILSQPKDFQQLDLAKLFVGTFGDNVITVDGHEWTRHRRIIASAITERISPIAWSEGIRQTAGMIHEICNQPEGKGAETVRFYDMVKTYTIHVLSKAGMGTEKEWTPQELMEATKKEDMTYMETVKLLNDNLTGPIIIPSNVLLNWPSFMPGYETLRRLGVAKTLFPIRTQEMILEEKQRLMKSNPSATDSSTNFLRNLVMASEVPLEEAEKQRNASDKKLPTLTDEEMISNLYLFTAAGYDTTSNTLAYAFTLLMRYPKWQEWLFEEIDRVFKGNLDMSTEELMSSYQTIFPHCMRILAFMHETLRLFTPVVHMAKMTRKPQLITTESGRKTVLPADLIIHINNGALHLDAKVWRDLNLDPKEKTGDWNDDIPGKHGATAHDIELGGGRLGDEWRFRPTRWIKVTPASQGVEATQTFFQPPRGSYVPWSAGPRVCPGQKMAQVEFTAIFVMILSKYKIEAVPRKGESPGDVNSRLDATMQNSISKLTLEMVDVYDKRDDDDESKGGLRVRLVKRRA